MVIQVKYNSKIGTHPLAKDKDSHIIGLGHGHLHMVPKGCFRKDLPKSVI